MSDNFSRQLVTQHPSHLYHMSPAPNEKRAIRRFVVKQILLLVFMILLISATLRHLIL